MRNKNKAFLWILTGIVVIGGLFVLPRILKKNDVNGAVPCLVPNVLLVQHIHPKLKIEVDGINENIPNEIGLSDICEKAIHTHEEGDGTIHVEAQDNRQYTLGDFFSVWGRSIERDGYVLFLTIDGHPFLDAIINDQPQPIKTFIILKDGQQIIMSYKTNTLNKK